MLLHGFKTLLPYISYEVIFYYPITIEKYLSFVAFLANTYMKELVCFFNSGSHLSHLAHQLPQGESSKPSITHFNPDELSVPTCFRNHATWYER